MPPELLVIVGPTAVGKTEVGILVAEALGGEIVSADSMQVYRSMDIGTAKPTPEQLSRVPYHLVSIINPDQPFSVADYQARADAAIADIRGRGHQPILVGGSGLYVRAVTDGLSFSRVPADRELRRRLTEQAESGGLAGLHACLAQADPEAAARIHPRDAKRIIRALEVLAHTGLPISRVQALDRDRGPRYNSLEIGLTLPRGELYRRIDARVERMIAEGLVEEVRRLADQGCDESLVAMKGLGYAQLLPFVRGRCSLEEAVERLKRETRRFAKRQLTWFLRAGSRVEWLDVEAVGGPSRAASLIRERWEKICRAG
jgi:tRNA dimethylallyltransferase